jgi:SAM-dependent methyltransferase
MPTSWLHEVTYFDVSNDCAAFARKIFECGNLNISMITDPEQLPKNNFDVVLCLDVLEHVPDPPSLVGWLAGLLREGGEFIAHAPFFYIDPAVPTHLRSNKKFSGDFSSLYEPHGLHPIAGRFFWDPIVLRKGEKHTRTDLPWNLRVGGALLKLGRYWSWPHIIVTKVLLKRKEIDL